MGVTDSRPRFCPRCGAGAVAGMPFCPQCGFDLAGVPRTAPTTTSAPEPPPSTENEAVAGAPRRPASGRPARVPAVVLAGLVVMVGLVGYGLLTRQPGTAPT